MPGVHDGHRQRLKEQFLKNGLDGFTPSQAMELLLFFAIPQKDTNELGHALLDAFGGVSGAMDAEFEELCAVKGMGPNAATLIKLIPQLARYYLNDLQRDVHSFSELDAVIAYLRPKFVGYTNERIYMLGLGNRGNLVCEGYMSYGGTNSAPIDNAEILKKAVSAKAVSVILAHNHPRGFAVPSAEDLTATMSLSRALRSVRIELAEHVIYAAEDCIALRACGLYLDAFQEPRRF